jgi:hypothetical protein
MPPVDRSIANLGDLLQQPSELDRIGAEILEGGSRAIRYRENRAGGKSMVFVARRDDVTDVLTDEARFSLCHYDPLYAAIAPPGAYLIMQPESAERTQRLNILRAAADETPWFATDRTARRDLARGCVDHILSTADRRPDRRFDLIGEYAFFAPYLAAKRVIGMSASRSFSLLSLIILANGHPVSQLFARETRPYLTDLVWSEFVLAQVLINFENRIWLERVVARHCASQLRRQIERQVDSVPNAFGDQTLLKALQVVRPRFPDVEHEAYREHVVSITMELAATILLFPGQAFQGIIQRWLSPDGPGLAQSLGLLDTMHAEAFVQEELRLAAPSSHLLRNATGSIELGGLNLERGEYVCALVMAAGMDIPHPQCVKAARPPETYLHFGPINGPHRCFGHLFAPTLIAEMFLGLTRLSGLALVGRPSKPVPVPGRMIVGFGALSGLRP